MKFADWITRKYIDWRGDAIGSQRSITEYARMIGVSHQVLSNWMNGAVPRRHATITKLADLYPEVYEVLGIEPPEDGLLSKLPEDLRVSLTAALKEMDDIFIERSIDPDSPEGKRVAAEVLTRHGFSVRAIS